LALRASHLAAHTVSGKKSLILMALKKKKRTITTTKDVFVDRCVSLCLRREMPNVQEQILKIYPIFYIPFMS